MAHRGDHPGPARRQDSQEEAAVGPAWKDVVGVVASAARAAQSAQSPGFPREAAEVDGGVGS